MGPVGRSRIVVVATGVGVLAYFLMRWMVSSHRRRRAARLERKALEHDQADEADPAEQAEQANPAG